LTAGKVIIIIIIDPYVYRLYWYVEAYNVTSPIVYRRLSWSSAQVLVHYITSSRVQIPAQLAI